MPNLWYLSATRQKKILACACMFVTQNINKIIIFYLKMIVNLSVIERLKDSERSGTPAKFNMG